MKKAKRGRDALTELHRKISPTILEEEDCSEALADDSPTKAPTLKTMLPQGKEKLRRLALCILLTHTLPRPFPAPLPQALHAAPYVQHGGMTIGCIHPHVTTCTEFSMHSMLKKSGVNAATCSARGCHKNCKYFHTNNTQKLLQLVTKPRKFKMCRSCMIIGCKGVGGHEHCTNK